ncbi:hypothetical protein SORBI_3005G083000 [Sorghum bicolor]|uniref:Uncharacterized protein n=1 Tax=Sorghum bicolor TaxID=4558 RepID=A0A1B6PQZ3_SORBI|nr:hypothetical protein SORBI_3005G083000 [Sorghum bicolor]
MCGMMPPPTMVPLMTVSSSVFPWMASFLLLSALWMCGMTSPLAMVPLMRVSSSSFLRLARCWCHGVKLFALRSLLALLAISRTLAVRYSRMAAV